LLETREEPVEWVGNEHFTYAINDPPCSYIHLVNMAIAYKGDTSLANGSQQCVKAQSKAKQAKQRYQDV